MLSLLNAFIQMIVCFKNTGIIILEIFYSFSNAKLSLNSGEGGVLIDYGEWLF